MGQTLTHGVYLPDEGERNCYNGLAGNWQLLDDAVGTVAEHTTQIAGKAPLVHTHTKSQITDFPVYGTTAGTICEGNDSRLSDARTPVAHTHGKADITDLFNSANVWTEENTFTANNINFKRSFTLGDSSYNICRLQYQDASLTRWGTLNFIHNTDNSVNCDIGVVAKKENDTVNVNASIRLTIKPDNSAELIPLNNNKINLGSSSYQWNNLYAKNYYYNGTAWGLDKANEWSKSQTISYAGSSVQFVLKHTETDISSSPTRNNWFYINFYDKNSISLGGFNYSKKTNGNSRVYLNLRTKNTNNDIVEKNIHFETNQEGTVWNLYPSSDAGIGLGTSDNKWATLNGVDPGALSLPDISDPDPIDTQNWVGNNSSSNPYTPTENGWIYFRVEGANKNITIRYGGAGGDSPSITSESTLSHVSVFFPVRSGVTMYIFFNGTMVKAFFYPCLGNV